LLDILKKIILLVRCGGSSLSSLELSRWRQEDSKFRYNPGKKEALLETKIETKGLGPWLKSRALA
jgi:hypothetical protein